MRENHVKPFQELKLVALTGKLNCGKLNREALAKDDGLSTAEYAVGTVAVAGLGGVLIKLLSSPEVRDLLWAMLTQALSSFTG